MPKLRNVELFDHFKKNFGNLGNKYWLSNSIYHDVGLSLNVKKLDIDDKVVTECWGGLQCKQYPEELGGLMAFLSDKGVGSYLEVGVERGGTFFTLDSFFRVVSSGYECSVGLDINNKINKKGLREYKDKFGSVDFIHSSSKNVKLDRRFDVVFIDGDHSYDGVKFDWSKFGCLANKFVVFHDILLSGCGVKELWRELVADGKFKSLTFKNENVCFPGKIGIGVLDVRG